MLPLGTKAPPFKLLDVVSSRQMVLEDFSNKKLLMIMFICRHCPYVKHVQEELARLGQDYHSKNVAIVAISSNDAQNHPEDSPEGLRAMADELKFIYPLCYDETQEVAKAYHAACTPEFYLFDQERKLIYRGQLDDSRPKNGLPVTGKDLRRALDTALNDQVVSPDQKPGIGCNIKWKKGNEPTYYSH